MSPKNNIWKEINFSFSEPKKALLSENVIRLQIKSKDACKPSNTKLN